jgi:hypothetical protein
MSKPPFADTATFNMLSFALSLCLTLRRMGSARILSLRRVAHSRSENRLDGFQLCYDIYVSLRDDHNALHRAQVHCRALRRRIGFWRTSAV